MLTQLFAAAAASAAACAVQGGMFIFDGAECVWSHLDQATGAHADFADVMKVADSINSKKDCGCTA
jgi:hypothetical protein